MKVSLSRTLNALVLATMVVVAPAQNRLLAPPPQVKQRLEEHNSRTQARMEQLRAERLYQEQKQAEFNALDAAGRKSLVDREFAAEWEKSAAWKLETTDEFLPEALSKHRLEFNGGKAVVRNAQEKVIARIAVGELLPVEHPDVSSYFLEVVAVDPEAKLLKARIGDVVYTLHADGKVDKPTHQELRARMKDLLSAYNAAEAGESFVDTVPDVNGILSLVRAKSQVAITASHLIAAHKVDFRVTARPVEFALSAYAISQGEDGGRGIVWEKDADGYYMRLFPIGENIFEQRLSRIELKSIAEDSSSAVLSINGDDVTIEPLGFLKIPTGGKSYIDGVVSVISAKWHEVVIDAGGRRLVLAMIPAPLAAKPISAKTRQEVRVRMLCNYLSHLTGLKIVPGSTMMETGAFTAEETPFGEVWKQFLAGHEWSYRWLGEDELLMDYPEYLAAPEIEAKRKDAN
ncbi:hypothetical protein IT570_13285 [Candidatus Sumerlaeota bacterium]|nr:hypothetical protein [Candidatus Sumerlaeota bacterium]